MSTLPEQVAPPQDQDRRSTAPIAKKIFRWIAAAAIALIGILIVTLASHPASKDYIAYWSAGQLLLHHADPYSPAQVFALEKTQGYTAAKPLIMRNPPWGIFLTAPLGSVNAVTGLLFWTIAAVGCILVSLWLLGVPPRDRALAFLFAPAIGSIALGQSSPFLLLGFSLFLRFYRSRPFLAGASLLLLANKPHLFLVFWVVLLVDCVYRRNFRILVGGASALATGSAFAMWLDPSIWKHYFAMMRASSLNREFFPTASMLFRLLIDPHAVWLLAAPSALAVIWGCWFYGCNRHIWDWRIQGLLLMLVTVLVSPYGWFSDEIVLLPSLIFAFSLPEQKKHSIEILVAINGVALFILLVLQPSINSGAYLWTPAAWLAWYLWAGDPARSRPQSDAASV
jgi:hypothetical protein